MEQSIPGDCPSIRRRGRGERAAVIPPCRQLEHLVLSDDQRFLTLCGRMSAIAPIMRTALALVVAQDVAPSK